MGSARRILILGGGFGGLHLVRHLERELRRGEADVTLVDRSNYSLFTPLLYQVATGELPPHAIAYPLRVPLAHAGVRFLRTEVEAIDVERHGVRVSLGTLVSEITRTSVRTRDGRTIPAQTAVWAGGIRTNPVVAAADLPHAKDGRLLVDAFFRAGGRGDVLAFGDAAAVDHDGTPLPQLAQVAVLEARAAAANIARLVRGEPLLPYRHKRKGDLIALGRTSAAAEFARPVHLVLSGLPAWTVWRTNYLMQLVGVRNRGTLLMEWLLSYFSRRIVADIT